MHGECSLTVWIPVKISLLTPCSAQTTYHPLNFAITSLGFIVSGKCLCSCHSGGGLIESLPTVGDSWSVVKILMAFMRYFLQIRC